MPFKNKKKLEQLLLAFLMSVTRILQFLLNQHFHIRGVKHKMSFTKIIISNLTKKKNKHLRKICFHLALHTPLYSILLLLHRLNSQLDIFLKSCDWVVLRNTSSQRLYVCSLSARK